MEDNFSCKIVFLTFADKRFINLLRRTEKESMAFPFAKRYFLTDEDLPKDFIRMLCPRLYRRGFGYWRWKPFIVKQCLDLMENNDILLYCDGGSFLNVKGMDRFNEYIGICQSIPSGILTFSQPFWEKDYTKGDLLQYFNVYNEESITMSLQLWAGAFMLRKCKESVEMVERWLEVSIEHPDLMTDKKSTYPNLHGFLEHRHDQSTFSILAKQYGAYILSYKEGAFCLTDKNSNLEKYPIQRKKISRKKYDRFRQLLTWPYRYAVGTWLIITKGFYFHWSRSF